MNAEPAIDAPPESPLVTELKRQLHWANLEIQVLKERLRLERIKKYGPGGEKLSDAQLNLLELAVSYTHLTLPTKRIV